MTEPETRPKEPEKVRPDPVPAAEPATSLALWPTFMRRTLTEDELRRPEPALGK